MSNERRNDTCIGIALAWARHFRVHLSGHDAGDTYAVMRRAVPADWAGRSEGGFRPRLIYVHIPRGPLLSVAQRLLRPLARVVTP